jgi:hypothetical protein
MRMRDRGILTGSLWQRAKWHCKIARWDLARILRRLELLELLELLEFVLDSQSLQVGIPNACERWTIHCAGGHERGRKRDAIVTVTMVGFLMIEFGNRSAEFQ